MKSDRHKFQRVPIQLPPKPASKLNAFKQMLAEHQPVRMEIQNVQAIEAALDLAMETLSRRQTPHQNAIARAGDAKVSPPFTEHPSRWSAFLGLPIAKQALSPY